MLLNNQSVNMKAYVSPFNERDEMKKRFIAEGMAAEKKKSEVW